MTTPTPSELVELAERLLLPLARCIGYAHGRLTREWHELRDWLR